MKTALILAALFVAFGIVGDIDYQTAAAMAAERDTAVITVAQGDHRDDTH